MTVQVDDFPQLKLLMWNRLGQREIDERDALAIYEANWRFIDEATLTVAERTLLARLVRDYGHGVLNV